MSHHLQHRHGKCMLSMLRDGMYDIAFRYEATYHVATFYDQGGDTVRPHQGGGSSDRRSGVDCEDRRALAIQNILNAHEHPPFLTNCTARITRSLNETFSSWGENQHDDLVLALSLACWFFERQIRRNRAVNITTHSR